MSSINNTRQKKSQQRGKGRVWMWQTVDGEVKRECIIHVYMPTTEHSEEELEKTEQLWDAETKGKNYTVVIGDFNVVVGEGKEEAYVGIWFEMS